MVINPLNQTAALAVGTTAADLPALTAGATPGGLIPMLFNVVGSEPVFVSWVGTAAIPASGATATSVPLQANANEILWVPAGSTISAIASATGSSLYVTAMAIYGS